MGPRADEGRGIAAISFGEPLAGFDPEMSECGDVAGFIPCRQLVNT